MRNGAASPGFEAVAKIPHQLALAKPQPIVLPPPSSSVGLVLFLKADNYFSFRG
jgi:hypothetical protein